MVCKVRRDRRESYALIGLLTPLGLPRLARYYVYFNLANYAYYAF